MGKSFITSLGEFILVGGAYDIGLVYVCVILAIRTPRKPPMPAEGG
jgi:hypothetical protein